MGDATTRARRARRPRAAGRAARPGLPGRLAWTTSTRSWSSGRWAARPSTTWRSCAGSSASWSGRATSSAAAASSSCRPRALRRLGATALRRVFAKLSSPPAAASTTSRDAGAAGEITGARREWRFGDEQPLDVVRTVRNAVLRTAGRRTPAGARCSIAAEDFEVVETERRTAAAVALLVDMSYSMELRGTWGEAKTTALALHSLVTTKYPQDAIEIIGFSATTRRCCRPATLVEHDWDTGAGHQPAARADAGPPAPRQAPRRRAGDPGDHRRRADRAPGRDGFADFCWPPTPETIAATLAEVERCTRRGATINVFMLDDEPAAGRVHARDRPRATAAGCSSPTAERAGRVRRRRLPAGPPRPPGGRSAA